MVPETATRPRVEGDREQEILDAALTVLAEVGYDKLTMDAVAAEAKASKATLYRRWSSKPELVVDAVCSHKEHPPVPDTGTLRGDLLAAYCGLGGVDPRAMAVIAAVVTAPLHKEALSAAGVPFPGHTELLQAEAAQHAGVSIEDMPVRMMLANEELRTVLVSIHVALRAAIDAVTYERVLETLRITDRALSAALGRRPRIAVAGLNPHAGEGGLFGREEIDVIVPAIEAARTAGIQAQGPFAPDTVFMRARRGEFDVVVAMYHDQGLIPVKYLGVEQGVNVTLGLPLVRTSPDHGTAFDIAGTGRADPSSLVEAIRMARRLAGD